LRDLIQTDAAIDPLKDFREAARQELRAFTHFVAPNFQSPYSSIVAETQSDDTTPVDAPA